MPDVLLSLCQRHLVIFNLFDVLNYSIVFYHILLITNEIPIIGRILVVIVNDFGFLKVNDIMALFLVILGENLQGLTIVNLVLSYIRGIFECE